MLLITITVGLLALLSALMLHWIIDDERDIRAINREIISINEQISSINRFIAELSSPSAITSTWAMTNGNIPPVTADSNVAVIMKDGQQAEMIAGDVHWPHAIAYKMVLS